MKLSSLILAVFVCLGFAGIVSADQQGATIFKSKGCMFCHKPEGPARGSIPALSELARAYNGKKDRLILYLEGNADPIVKPEKSVTMKRQLRKTKALSDSERSSLADFMLQR